MIPIILNLLVISVAAVLSELLWRKKKFSSEDARKLMHIFGGTLTATWPAYMSWSQIQTLIVIIVIAITTLRLTGLARSFFAVKRQTIGDVLGPLTIGILAFFDPPVVLFVLVVLHITYADGMAAVIGTHFGQSNSYTVLGYKKSIAGTFTCFIFSFLIMLGTLVFGHFSGPQAIAGLLVIPPAIATIENISVFGIDNTLIALMVGVLAKAFNFY